MKMDKGYFEYNGGKLYFESTGKGDPLLFVHGFTLDHRMWTPQVESFSSRYTVYTYDMRGFGQSSSPVGRYSHHDDLRALIEFLHIKKVHLVGLSLGGEIAIDFCLQSPSFVRSLTLVDSSLGGYKSTVDWNLHAKEHGIEQGKKNWLNHDVFASTHKKDQVFNTLQKIVDEYSGWHLINSDPRDKVLPHAKERLNEIKVPSLIIVGEHDLSYFHDISKVLHSRIHGSVMKIIKDAGHMVNLEHPDSFNEVLSTFLKSV